MALSGESNQNTLPTECTDSCDENGICYDNLSFASEVLEAAGKGDLQKVKNLITSGILVNTTDQDGNTPLHIAAINNNVEIIDYLLAQDDVVMNVRNVLGNTPLYNAAKFGNFESISRLILAGADVNISNNKKETPLHISVVYPEIAHFLIMHDAHIDAQDEFGNTPLHHAIEQEYLEIVCMLLYFNADANIIGLNNLTPFMKALTNCQTEIQQTLLEYVLDFNATREDGMSILHLALYYNSPYVEEIIERGAEVNYIYKFRGRRILNTFFLCLQVPNPKNFKLIWDRFNCTHNLNLCTLYVYLDRINLEKYIEIIIESVNINTAVTALTKRRNYCSFIHKFAINELKLEQLTKLTCRLILHELIISSIDVNEIFANYGYCELVKILLYTNPYKYDWLPHMIVPRLIFDLDYKLSKEIADKIYYSAVPKLLEIFNYPPLTNALKDKLKDNIEMLQIINSIPKVPLLQEISRNKAREHIATKFATTNACQFYTIVNYLNISPIFKKILKFETKLYHFNA